ncbi:MAG: tetratricopeptide repeat protein, partial [Acidobacteria bacterium]|nr:tetratricopeptide repeat protein [Acidobacteriota bacterium]
MSILDFIFHPRDREPRDRDQLRDLLFEAARKERRQFERLCRANRAFILKHFPEWRMLPDTLPRDQASLKRYGDGLMAIACFFSDHLGHPELVRVMQGDPETDPLKEWGAGFRTALQLMEEARYAEARDRLSSLIDHLRGLQGVGLDRNLALTLGRLGECHLQGGEASKAIPCMDQALELCRQSGDNEGIVAYLANLYEAHRYLGDSRQAFEAAKARAAVLHGLGRSSEAADYERRAAMASRGEPLNRVVALVKGERFEVRDVEVFPDQNIQLVYERNRITLRPAELLNERGMRLGDACHFEQALASFEAAAKVDAYDPESRYQRAFTLLYLRRYTEGRDSYAATEQLAPGWYRCRSELHLADLLAQAKLPHESFQALHILEEGQQPPEQNVRLAESILTRSPDLAQAY